MLINSTHQSLWKLSAPSSHGFSYCLQTEKCTACRTADWQTLSSLLYTKRTQYRVISNPMHAWVAKHIMNHVQVYIQYTDYTVLALELVSLGAKHGTTKSTPIMSNYYK